MRISSMSPLKVGDTVGIVSPATSPDDGVYQFAKEFLETKGYTTQLFGVDAPPFGRMTAPLTRHAHGVRQAGMAVLGIATLCMKDAPHHERKPNPTLELGPQVFSRRPAVS